MRWVEEMPLRLSVHSSAGFYAGLATQPQGVRKWQRDCCTTSGRTHASVWESCWTYRYEGMEAEEVNHLKNLEIQEIRSGLGNSSRGGDQGFGRYVVLQACFGTIMLLRMARSTP